VPSADVNADGAASPPHVVTRLQQRWVTAAAAWFGLAYLWVVLGYNIYRQWIRVPILDGRADAMALVGVAVAALSLATGRRTRVQVALGGLLAIWLAAPALSAWGLSGAPDPVYFRWAAIGCGLYFGVVAARPLWSGWSIVVLGSVYLLLNLIVYWKAYYSLGTLFPGASIWWSSSAGGWVPALPSLEELQGYAGPYPQSLPGKAWALITQVPGLAYFQLHGMTVNATYTGDFVGPFVVFAVAFLASARRRTGTRWVRWAVVSLLLGILAVGFFLLFVLDAPTAIGAGVIAILASRLVPAGAARGRLPIVAAVAIPLVALSVPLVTKLAGLYLSGRNCVWASWWARVAENPVFGGGPPGAIENVCGDFFIVNAHNELLQSISIGGLLGLVASVGVLVILGWLSVRYLREDDRVLLAVMICYAVLMPMEVFTTDWAIMWFIAMSARSVGVIGGRDDPRSVDPSTPVASART